MDEVMHSASDRIPMRNVAIGMVAKAWYPVNYFRISFGAKDKMAQLVRAITQRTGWTADWKATQIHEGLLEKANNPTFALLLDKILVYVPYRFIRPWFSEQLRRMPESVVDKSIRELANAEFDLQMASDPTQAPPYKFEGNDLIIHPAWVPFIRENYKILHDFTIANLLEYLQRRNPHIPNLVSKLYQPLTRSLTTPRKHWKETLESGLAFACIYSQQPLHAAEFDLDHFLPWSYLAHDQLWNLVPASSSANSSKSDHLPRFDTYFPAFAVAQKRFFDFQFDQKHLKALEDYGILFQQSLPEIRNWQQPDFSQYFANLMHPQFEIARNMGFSDNWSYNP